MTNDEIIKAGSDALIDEAKKSGMGFEICNDEHDGVLDGDDDYLSFTTTIKAADFMSDDGEIKPEPVTFEMQYDRDLNEYGLTIGEGDEISLTYGNVMAIMYFNLVPVSA